jgi:hypothetical protein
MSEGNNRIEPAQAEPERRPTPAPQPFPVDALPPVMAKFADEVGRSLCVDPAMAALPMLSVAGAAIGNTARARMSADYHAPPNVWTAPVVLSGDRKSPVLRAVMQPVYSRQHEAAEQYKQRVAEYETALEQWKKLTPKERRATDRPVEPGPFPHYYLSDTTTEAIALRLSQQPRGLAVVLDELAAFFSGMNQYRAKGGNDRESYLAFYDAGAAKVDRKSATPPTIFIPRAFVAVTGMIQPGALARALGPAEFDSGLAARFLLAGPEPRQATWSDGGVSEAARENWGGLLGRMLDTPLPEHPALIPPSDAAMRQWAHAHDLLERDRFNEADDRMRAARAKLIGVIPRLALIFQCVSAASGERTAGVRFIDEVSMTRAIVLAEWFTREAGRVYGLLVDEEGEDDILARIERNGGSVTPRELMRWSRAQFRTVALAESFLESLVHDCVGRWEWRRTRGRPSRVFTPLYRGDGDKTPPGAGENGHSVTVISGNGNNGGESVSAR